MSIIRNRLYQFKQELLSNKDRAWYSHTNLLTAVDLLIEKTCSLTLRGNH